MLLCLCFFTRCRKKAHIQWVGDRSDVQIPEKVTTDKAERRQSTKPEVSQRVPADTHHAATLDIFQVRSFLSPRGSDRNLRNMSGGREQKHSAAAD